MNKSQWIPAQIKATKALIKFIQDHDDEPDSDLVECLRSLEANDIDSAVKHAKLVKPHGMGGITDWWPPAKYENETSEYVTTVLFALVNHWCHQLSLSFNGK